MTRWDALARQLLDDWERAGYGDLLLEAIWPELDGVLTPDDIAAFRRCDPVDRDALARLLDHPRARHVVKSIVHVAYSVPDPLFMSMVKAGVQTIDPSYNRQFITPCVLCHGRRRTMAALVSIAKDGSNADKVGAVNGLYWGSMSALEPGWYSDGPWQTSVTIEEPVDDLEQEIADWALKEFLENPDVDVRRSLLSYLPKPSHTAPAGVKRAIAIAETHDDPYIRDRLAAQLGRSPAFPSLPHRKPKDESS